MSGLLPFLAHRLFRALIALWLVSTVVFVVMRLSGDPVPLLLPPDAPHSEIMRVRHDLGLDQPLPIQYGVFLANLARGDFGRSIHFREPAFSESTRMKRIPRKNVGADWPMSATPIATWSTSELRFIADMRPIGTATSAARKNAVSPSSSVAPRYPRTTVKADSRK